MDLLKDLWGLAHRSSHEVYICLQILGLRKGLYVVTSGKTNFNGLDPGRAGMAGTSLLRGTHCREG